MRGFFKTLVVAALALARRLLVRAPIGEYERIVFDAIYEAGQYTRKVLA